ncbi:williams-Beuren syndrome DDT (WSD), d-TOX E motif domain-containing protein [Hirsutella rhossiliensis]|uniref:Williams-Beuren syndrome DDT (WSD), d-TOX E motif domain-containing protein n=1 Tax=Hirsutella rhossiliensis TaxID=111463 RepID=A0A9P8MTQ6_9HYPO|nr:williams-Beuren syndrome DDT (WSD), d-TOX E motif domain-containing protein [Hirsutella rhossiliensis]KAH0960026.1 williams-Beuren syndrome DDT (WSD), d-TOX E motif domain-containing protein [Hirsutella rhossiliensis]
MVLFKRKPVKFLPPPDIEDDATEVWHIPQTGEVFTTYEDYLSRMEFYKQRRFNDQITGHSGLTFLEAFNSEVGTPTSIAQHTWLLYPFPPPMSVSKQQLTRFNVQLTGGREVEASFPEALKGPILRKVQFQTISRLDNLVDMIYDEFKHDFYPGEEVTVTMDGGERVHGLVRDKTTFGPRMLSDGSHTQPVTRYLVNVKDSEEETMVTDEHICRDRGVFTKSMLRSFIKKTVIREAWTGAPWLVKHDYAGQYHIDTRVPPHLRYDTKVQERRQLQAQKRAPPYEVNGHGSALHSGPVRLPELKPAPKNHKGKQGQHGSKGLKWPLNMSVNGANGAGYPSSNADNQGGNARGATPPPPPPPPPKYPIEDLQLEPKEGSVRPPLKFLCRDPPVDVEGCGPMYDQIDMASVGALLETWDTLNVYCEIFRLDSFTFDDFIEAMSVSSERVHVQLFEEVHCAVLKVLVDSERDGGKVQITLPKLEEEDSDGEEGESEADNTEPTPEPELKPTGRATRSSLAKLEAERLAAEAAAAEEESLRAELESRHRAEELLKEYDWIEHLRQRDFAKGGWQRIIVGLLHQLSKNERREKACEELLLQLVPPNTSPTQDAVQQTYASLSINYRVQALQILCMLTMETKAVRGYMEDCSETMTKYRKDRIEWQRQRKQAMEDLRQLNEERRALMPDNSPTGELNPSVKKEEDVKMIEVNESQIEKEADAEGSDEDNNKSQKKRRGRGQSDKQRKRDEERERKSREKEKEREKLKQYNKVVKEIQKKEDIIKGCESEIAVIENDLREADCPRTRVLGKDRFWNRYYWFERNGMPYAGLPNSSTAYAEYANGCIWVQGPDELEREGYIDVPAELQDEHKTKFNMTIPERKAMEEGGMSVFNARQWGYICEPEDVDQLIRWLDPRGINELKLRKELLNYKDKMAAHMEKRKKYLAAATEPGTTAADTTKDKKDEAASKRTSSRIRDKSPEPPSYRCLQWQNTMALDELGHLHVEQTPPPRAKKQTKKREAMSEPAGRGVAKIRRR